MDVARRLASDFLQRHPQEAAAVLETLAVADAAAILADLDPAKAASLLSHAAPHAAAAIGAQLPDATLAVLLAQAPVHAAARILRRLAPEVRERALSAIPERQARLLRPLVHHAENTAGFLMDPEVLALPGDVSAREAVARVREAARHARYNIYVVDREHLLVGVMNLRELFLAAPRASLESFMTRDVQRLSATADRRAIVDHPGWREVHSLPVVDESGVYLGAIRYRALRRIQRELEGRTPDGTSTAGALGELFATGASGLLEALRPSANVDKERPQ